FAVSRKVREVGQHNELVSDLAAELAHLLMRQFQELLEDGELMHQLQRGWMDRVAAEVTQKVRMLLEHHNINTGPSQQETQHHPRRSAADDGLCTKSRIESNIPLLVRGGCAKKKMPRSDLSGADGVVNHKLCRKSAFRNMA